jgi:hypothetical protein
MSVGPVAHPVTSLAAARVWAPPTGFPSWPALAGGRSAGAVALTGAFASFAFAFATCALGRQT